MGSAARTESSAPGVTRGPDGYFCATPLRAVVALSVSALLVGCAVLLVALPPTGLALLRAVERVLRYRFHLTVLERLIAALYAGGTLLYVVASIPAPIYGGALVAVILTAGAVACVASVALDRGRGLRVTLSFGLSPVGLLLGVGFVGLFLFEVVPIWNHPFPDAWDGSVTALWMNLTLKNGTLPFSLQPFSSAPVVYPLATTVWMTLPVVLAGWPIVQSPLYVPALFLSLTVPAAYCWGARWGAGTSAGGTGVGLLFATFFGLVASWPRFYTGGSYDFALAFPLVFVAFGLVPSFARSSRLVWPQLVGMGLLLGTVSALGVAAGEALLALVLAFALLSGRPTARASLSWLGKTAILALIEIAFNFRSVTAWVVNHQPAFTPSNEYGPLNARLVQGELDPLVPWKAKLSVFPWVSVELQVLLVVGGILAGWAWWTKSPRGLESSLSRFGADLLIGIVALAVLVALLLPSALPGSAAAMLRSFTNLDQTSYLLFTFYSALCTFPLVVGISWVTAHRENPSSTVSRDRLAPAQLDGHRAGRSRPGTRRPAVMALAVVAMVVVISIGAGFSVLDGPGYIQQNVGKTSNVTPGDVAALEWAGANLPSCSAVLVAPGSAGQFLPEYATLHVVFPMNPVPQNGSYISVVNDLTQGVYTNTTRTSLESLGVTEVLVTGQTSVTYLPFLAAPLNNSSDFSLLFLSGDALMFLFHPGVARTLCEP